MAQLRLGYPEMKRHGAQIFQITSTPVKQGPLYARRFTLPFPYLCDGDYAVHRRYGLTTKGLLNALWLMVKGTPRMVSGALKNEQPSLAPYLTQGPRASTMEQAMFLVDRAQRVRFRNVAGPHAHIPTNEMILNALASL